MSSEDAKRNESAVSTIVNLAEEAKLAREGVKSPDVRILSICKSQVAGGVAGGVCLSIYGDDDGDEDETKYQLRFDGEMDPLDFIENNASGVELYQHFQRFENEYEALAAKKRKALATSGNSAKKLRNDGDYTQTFEEMMEGMSYDMGRKSKKKNKKRGRRKGSKKKVSPEVTRKLGDATLHYANERYGEAICLLKEVIRFDSYLPDPYHTLGLVYNAIGDKKKQIGCYMLAAHLSPKDGYLWKHLVTWSIYIKNAVSVSELSVF